jgi:polar amino acid transport system ATP-binding protein
MSAVVEIKNLHKSFGTNHVLRGIDFTVEQGEVVCVIGPSGSGKSTLLRCVNLLEVPEPGSQVIVSGEDITDPDCHLDAARSRIGMVFQQFNLFPHLSVLANCTVAQTTVLRRNASTADEIARGNLDRVGLNDKVDAYPMQLSGGQQQRVAIARALFARPDVLFADEPTGALDRATGRQVLELLQAAARDHGQTIVMVTHDPLAASYADTLLFLADGLVVGRLHDADATAIAAAMSELER